MPTARLGPAPAGARPRSLALARLAPLDRDSTPSRIAARIRAAIVSGHLPPGTQLTEVPLAERLGVSRGPVREALQRLIQEGLLLSGRHQGTFVADLDPAQIEDLYLTRELLEAAAAERLAQQPGGRRLEALAAALEQLRRAEARGTWAKVVEADLGFHGALIATGGSIRLSRTFETLSVETRICLRRLEPFYPQMHDVVAEHEAVLGAIEAGDAPRANALVRAHMRDAAARLVGAASPPDGPEASGSSPASERKHPARQPAPLPPGRH